MAEVFAGRPHAEVVEALVATVAIARPIARVEIDRGIRHFSPGVTRGALTFALEDVHSVLLALGHREAVARQVSIHRCLVRDQRALVGLDRLTPDGGEVGARVDRTEGGRDELTV